MTRPPVHLVAVGTALPGPPIDNATLAARFGLPQVWQQWVDTFVGTRSRHYAVDLETGEVRYTLADLAETAGRRALATAGIDATAVELMVMSTSSPDLLMPATVNQVADRLGIDGIPTFQLQSGCAGAVQALEVASRMLGTGDYGNALVLGGDTSAKHFDAQMNSADLPAEAQINGLLFGDGAGAAVLSAEPVYGAPVLCGIFTRLVGLGRSPGQVVDWYSWGHRTSDRPPVVEDFKAVEQWAPQMAADALDELLDGLGWKKPDLDYLLPPQLSGRMTERVLDELSVPAEPISRVLEIGNTGNAIPYFQLEQVLPRLSDGDRLAGISVEASKWVIAGYALEMAAD